MLARAFLIDGHSFCYRAFYAIRELSTSTGRPTNAIYGFITMLSALVEQERPEYLAVAFDLPKPTFRHERFKDYKVHRRPMPDALIEQLPTIHDVLAAMRIPVFEREGFEADDVLATIARELASPALEVTIVTGDKDALQLVGPHIKVYAPKPQEKIYDEDAVRERFGVAPAQIPDLMALMGDLTDNIPAVPGIGEKTATALIQEFHSFDGLMRQIDRVENVRQREALQAHAEQAKMARELATADAHVPITVTLEDLARQEPDAAQLQKLYRALEFKALLKKLIAEDPPETAAQASVTVRPGDAAAWRAAAQSAAIALVPVPDAERRVRGLAVVWEGDACYCPGANAWQAAQQPLSQLPAGTRVIVHDWKSLTRGAPSPGIRARGPVFDTMLAAYLLNPAHAHPGIEDLAAQYLDQTVRWESVDLSTCADDAVARMAASVGATLLVLAPRLEAELESKTLDELYRTVELPLSDVLARMEREGVAVDLAVLRDLSQWMERELTTAVRTIYTAVGHEFNLNSPKQLAHVLFEELKLPVVKRTKTGPSTDAETLATLAASHPLPAQLVTYRELSKLKSTYVDALPLLVDPSTGRLHTTFHQTVTATGRLSSSDPNLQNIPTRTELGRRIRRAFVPGHDGWMLLSADYSQIELRILAHLSGDETLRRAFLEGRDVHRYTASLIGGVDETAVTSAMRSAAKTVNFGVIYGMQAHGLSRELRIGIEEAQAFIEQYFARYPGVRRYAEAQVTAAKRTGYVTTILGRRRYIPELHSLQGSVRQFGERTAMNAPIQGSAADLIKVAMIAIHRALADERLSARMLLQVHDDLVFEVPREELTRVAQMVRRHMREAMHLTVPVEVTLKTGPNWADMDELRPAS